MQAIAASAARLRSKSIPKVQTANEPIPPSPTMRTLLVEKYGKPHHPFPRSLAPYPINYEKALLDAEALDLAFRLQIYEGNPTSIPDIRLDSPKTHPRRCLDLGCSSGDWILAASRCWPDTTFVGVDLIIGHQIPVHLLDSSPHDLQQTPYASTSSEDSKTRSNTDTAGNPTLIRRPSAFDGNHPVVSPPPTPLGSRIRWVQANFLKSLPFGDGEFDYIHVSGIARGVPEDKWDSLFAEISRVLAINGHLEMFEEDVIFPILPTEEQGTTATPLVGGSGRNGSIASNSTTNTSRTSISSHKGGDLLNDDKSRRPSFSANRFAAAATASASKVPPVPPLRLNTKLSQQFPPTYSLSANTRPADFPFTTSKSYTRVEGPPTGPLDTGSKTMPKKRCDDPAIPQGFDGPIKRCNDPAIPQGWEGPIKRCDDPAIPQGWDGPPQVPRNVWRDSPQEVSFPSPRKEGKSSRRPRTASSVATSFKALSTISPSLPFSQKIRRPTSAGSGARGSTSRSGSMDLPIQAPPGITHSSSSKRHVKQSSYSTQETSKSAQVIKHDHHILQTLFFSVYEGRFINTSPTAILPSYFNIYFQNVSVTPPIDFPTPPRLHTAREMIRRDKRNTTQREWGSGGLEQSRGVTMNLPGMFGDPMKTQYEPSPITADRNLKRVQSSPGMVTEPNSWLPHRNSSPFSANSMSTGGSSISLSRTASYLPTPVSAQSTHPYIEGSEDTPLRQRFGRDGALASPDGVSRLHHQKSTTFSLREPAPEEEEDAKLAIMGDGGCFPIEDTTEVPERTLSTYPSLASLKSNPSLSRSDGRSQKQNDEDTLFDALETLEMDSDEEGTFDQLAAEELEIFDIIGRPEGPAPGSMWSNGYEEIGRRVYVRPRKAFSGLGMHVPSQLLGLDDLSMGVHLTRAWLNVVACKEAMWDELQRRAQVVQSPTQEAPIDLASPSLQRVTLLDEVEWIGSEARMADREKFELLFLRFEDDMRQWAAVGSSIPRKLSWIDPRYPNLGPVPSLSSNRNTLRSSTTLNGALSADDGFGPGHDGIIIPGVDVCRTIRVFTGQKLVDHPPGCNASKILGIL